MFDYFSLVVTFGKIFLLGENWTRVSFWVVLTANIIKNDFPSKNTLDLHVSKEFQPCYNIFTTKYENLHVFCGKNNKLGPGGLIFRVTTVKMCESDLAQKIGY